MLKKIIVLFIGTFCIGLACFAQKINVSFSPQAWNESFTGKVYLYFSKENKEPKDGIGSLTISPCFSMEVKHLLPGKTITFDDNAISYPAKLSDMERGSYYVQAVWDRNMGGRSIANSPGNMFNKSQKITLTKDNNKSFSLLCDQVVPPKNFIETKFVKEEKIPSPQLSKFSKKLNTIDAAIILPEEYYKDSTTQYPTIYIVSGYGGDYHEFSTDTLPSDPFDSIPCIWVYLDGNCPLGHSVYANSDNNGPWGDALTREFIPAIESKYRCNGARLLTGHSSGGFTVLWLQTHYPKVFAGCTSSSPDPVDFRSFQKINLYEDKNFYYSKDSSLNPVASVGGFINWFYFKDLSQQENVIDRGEQLHSFDAVFSKKSAAGTPERICDPVTGQINQEVVEHWKKYDISLYLRNNWNELKNDLEGKVRVSVGKQDNFFLNYAVKLLEAEMKKINADMSFAYYPGDHFTVATRDYRKDEIAFLKKRYLLWLKNNPSKTK